MLTDNWMIFSFTVMIYLQVRLKKFLCPGNCLQKLSGRYLLSKFGKFLRCRGGSQEYIALANASVVEEPKILIRLSLLQVWLTETKYWRIYERSYVLSLKRSNSKIIAGIYSFQTPCICQLNQITSS